MDKIFQSFGKYNITIFLISVLALNSYSQDIVSNSVETVVIDAGHGGHDPGAIGKFSNEKAVALAIALKTGELISKQNPDVKVIYTRQTDKYLKLYERADVANKNKADLFISIHANSNNSKTPNGVEFYVLGLHKSEENLAVAKKENEVVNQEGDVTENYGFDPNSPEGNIIMTMKQSLYLDKSVKFAKSIEKHFHNESSQVIRGTKQAGFVVLYKTSMPSVLVETGFISNPQEEIYLNSPQGQLEISEKIANAFKEFKTEYEGSSSSNTQTNTLNSNSERKVIDITEDVNNGTYPNKVKEEKTIEIVEETPVSSASVTEKDGIIYEKVNSIDKSIEDNIIILDDEINETPKTMSSAKEAAKKPSYIQNENIKQQILDNATTLYGETSNKGTKTKAADIPSSGMIYKVQVKAAPKAISSNDKLYSINESIEESQEGGYYKYLIGSYSSLSEATSRKNSLKNKGIVDAFVVKYQNGTRVK